MLNGDNDLTEAQNIELHKAISKYIIDTGRFD